MNIIIDVYLSRMKNLSNQLKEIESFLPKMDLKNSSISKVTVGWQVNHSLKVINSVYKSLEISIPSNYIKKNSFAKSFIMLTGFIPRGKARAPKAIKIEEAVSLEDLKRRLKFAFENVENLKKLQKGSYFSHPYFGDLRLKESVRFLRIHTEHHLKICREILKSH